MRLIFHGVLAESFGEFIDMSVDTVAEGIEGFSRQNPTWPRDMRIALVTSTERLDTHDKLLDYHDEVHILPSLIGGSGKFGSIILGAALIGINFIPGIGQAISAIAVGLKSALIVAGVTMIAQGVLGMFMKAPKVNSTTDPDASKYLPVNKNTVDVGTPIVLAWGRINLAGQWLSLQSDSSNLSYGSFPVTPT